MKIVIREAADRDLDQIFAWIARDRPRAARAVIDRILSSVELLGRFPYVGRAGKVPGTREWVVRGLPYIVVYSVHEEADALTILAIFHGARKR